MALADLAELSLQRHPHTILLPRIWELRHNLTAYDAAYIALAEALDAPLLTRDTRLAGASGHRARIEVV
jgi:predicted nucleic acid-binding protein